MSQTALAYNKDVSSRAPGSTALVSVRGMKKYYPIHAGLFGRVAGYVRAVDGVSFEIPRGKTLGLVGESGCGKTTVGKTLLRLTDMTGGEVMFDGKAIHQLDHGELRRMRSRMQIIFQDPYSSLSPRLPIGEIIAEAVREHNIVPRSELNAYVTRVMRSCELQTYHKDRYPHEFSGGQRQRICIARALALNPDFIVCDEPVSALDVSIQAQIINLLADLQREFGMAYLFISHDLSVVEHISDAVGVMYLGQMVEYGECREIFSNPLHPYTKALFSAIPIPDPTVRRERIILEGSLPSPAQEFRGCRFQSRCKQAMKRCQEEKPIEKDVGGGHRIVCHLY